VRTNGTRNEEKHKDKLQTNSVASYKPHVMLSKEFQKCFAISSLSLRTWSFASRDIEEFKSGLLLFKSHLGLSNHITRTW